MSTKNICHVAFKVCIKARRDNEWGQRSIYNMIEICLNPDNTTLGGEVFESVDSDVHAESRDSQEMALRTADKLLKELKPKGGQQQMSFQLLQGMLQLATKNKVRYCCFICDADFYLKLKPTFIKLYKYKLPKHDYELLGKH